MEHDVRAQLHAMLGFDVAELAQAEISARIPMADALLNRLISERLSRGDAPVSTLRVHALDGDTLHVYMTIKRLSVLPTLKLQLQIERQPRPDDPVLVIRWALPSLGPFASLAGSIVSALRNLPRGIRIDGHYVLIDVREVAGSRGLSGLLEFIRDIQVHTRPGVLLVNVTAAVP